MKEVHSALPLITALGVDREVDLVVRTTYDTSLAYAVRVVSVEMTEPPGFVVEVASVGAPRVVERLKDKGGVKVTKIVRKRL